MTFTLPTVLTALALGCGFIWFTISLGNRIGNYTGKLDQLLVAIQRDSSARAEEILSLRISRHEHGEKIIALETQVTAIETDVGEIFHRRRGERRPSTHYSEEGDSP